MNKILKYTLIFIIVFIAIMSNAHAATKIKWLDDTPLPYRLVEYDEKLDLWLCCDTSWSKYSPIDDNGNKILKGEYKKILSVNGNEYTVYDENHIKRIDKDGNVKQQVSGAYRSDNAISITQDGKAGLIDIYGNIKIPCIYYFLHTQPLENNVIIAENADYKYGIIDLDGNIIVPIEYDSIIYTDNIFTLRKNGKVTIADKNCNLILPLKYDNVNYYSDNVIVAGKGNKIGIVDAKDNIRLPFDFDSLSYYSDDIIIAKKGENYGIIDITGNTRVEYNYNSLQIMSDNVVVAENNKKYGIIDFSATIKLPIIYDYLEYYSNNLIEVKQHGKTSYLDINRNPKNTIPEGYRFREYYSDNAILASKIVNNQHQYGLLDVNGNERSEFIFHYSVKYYSDDMIIAKINSHQIDKSGIIDVYGNTLLPFAYESITYYESTGYIVAKQSYGHVFRGALEQIDFKLSPKDQFVLYIDACFASVWGDEKYNDVPPIILNDRTMLPIRFIAENLNANVEWNHKNQKATITKDNIKIEMVIGSDKIFVNNKETKVDSPPVIKGNRTYVPVRFLAETLDFDVQWTEENQSITITKH